jgi:hypothetical protein
MSRKKALIDQLLHRCHDLEDEVAACDAIISHLSQALQANGVTVAIDVDTLKPKKERMQ